MFGRAMGASVGKLGNKPPTQPMGSFNNSTPAMGQLPQEMFGNAPPEQGLGPSQKMMGSMGQMGQMAGQLGGMMGQGRMNMRPPMKPPMMGMKPPMQPQPMPQQGLGPSMGSGPFERMPMQDFSQLYAQMPQQEAPQGPAPQFNRMQRMMY